MSTFGTRMCTTSPTVDRQMLETLVQHILHPSPSIELSKKVDEPEQTRELHVLLELMAMVQTSRQRADF